MYQLQLSGRDWNRWYNSSGLGPAFLLAQVEMDWIMLEAATNHWDPVDKVFRFGTIELCPTLEEYTQFLSLTPKDKDKAKGKVKEIAIVPQIKSGYTQDIGGFLKLKKHEMPPAISASCPRPFLWEKAKHYRYDDYEDERRVRALTAIVAAEILFPGAQEEVDGAIFNVLNQMQEGRLLSSVLIAETIQSLTQCVRFRRGTLGGCPALLQAWLREHIPGLCVRFYEREKGASPAESHAKQRPAPMFKHIKACESYLGTLKEEHIVWTLKWMKPCVPRLVLPGKHYMILFSIGSTVVYSPYRVLRQFGMKQQVPSFKGKYQHLIRITSTTSGKTYEGFYKLWQDTAKHDLILETTDNPVVAEGYEAWVEDRKNEALGRRRVLEFEEDTDNKSQLYEERVGLLQVIGEVISEKDAIIAQLRHELEEHKREAKRRKTTPAGSSEIL